MNLGDIDSNSFDSINETIIKIYSDANSSDEVANNDSYFKFIEEEVDIFANQMILLENLSKRAKAVIKKTSLKSQFPENFFDKKVVNNE